MEAYTGSAAIFGKACRGFIACGLMKGNQAAGCLSGDLSGVALAMPEASAKTEALAKPDGPASKTVLARADSFCYV